MTQPLKLPRQDEVRNLIRANRILVRLQQFVLGRKFQGNPVVMSAAQVRAAVALLNKILPDLTAIDFTGEINHNFIARTPHVSGTVDEWTEQHTPRQLQ